MARAYSDDLWSKILRAYRRRIATDRHSHGHLGALISLAAMIQGGYAEHDVRCAGKAVCLPQLLLSCFLLAPDVPRLVRFLFLNRATAPSTQVRLFRGIRPNRIALAAQIIFGLWLIGVNFHQCRFYWNTQGGGRPLLPFYGIWEVRQMSIDEQPRPPLLTDSNRWRRAIFDVPSRNCAALYKQVDTYTSVHVYGLSAPGRFARSLWRLRQSFGQNSRPHEEWRQELGASFTFQRPAGDQLILDGRMDNHQVHMELQLADRNLFPLVSRGFRWIMEAPFGRN